MLPFRVILPWTKLQDLPCLRLHQIRPTWSIMRRVIDCLGLGRIFIAVQTLVGEELEVEVR